jgi:hypothetical protein
MNISIDWKKGGIFTAFSLFFLLFYFVVYSPLLSSVEQSALSLGTGVQQVVVSSQQDPSFYSTHGGSSLLDVVVADEQVRVSFWLLVGSFSLLALFVYVVCSLWMYCTTTLFASKTPFSKIVFLNMLWLVLYVLFQIVFLLFNLQQTFAAVIVGAIDYSALVWFLFHLAFFSVLAKSLLLLEKHSAWQSFVSSFQFRWKFCFAYITFLVFVFLVDSLFSFIPLLSVVALPLVVFGAYVFFEQTRKVIL